MADTFTHCNDALRTLHSTFSSGNGSGVRPSWLSMTQFTAIVANLSQAAVVVCICCSSSLEKPRLRTQEEKGSNCGSKPAAAHVPPAIGGSTLGMRSA